MDRSFFTHDCHRVCFPIKRVVQNTDALKFNSFCILVICFLSYLILCRIRDAFVRMGGKHTSIPILIIVKTTYWAGVLVVVRWLRQVPAHSRGPGVTSGWTAHCAPCTMVLVYQCTCWVGTLATGGRVAVAVWTLHSQHLHTHCLHISFGT